MYGGSCVEDVSSHLMETLCLHPHLRTCSADTILRVIRELTTPNQSYRSASGKSYDFNVASDLNNLLVNALLATGQLLPDNEYDFDFGHQFIKTEKFDAKMTYKKFTGYSPGIATGGDVIVGIENRDGNTNVRFRQDDTLKRIFERLENARIHINRARMDCGSCSEAIVDILTNDYTSTDRDIVEYYNKRGGAGRILDDMNNGFGWKRLPKSFMAENTVFLLLTALIRNFYRHLISDANMKSFGLKRTSRIKTFVFKHVSVPAKWVKTARQHILNIYTSNDAYMMAFKFDFG